MTPAREHRVKRYVSKPPNGDCRTRSDDDYWWRESDGAWHAEGEPRTITVEEDDRDTFSGLYDASGEELHHVRPRMGFDLGHED